MDDYTSRTDSGVHWTALTVAVSGANCDDSGLTWKAQTQVTKNIQVGAGATDVVLKPYVVDEASKQSTPEMRACSTYTETYTLTVKE